MKISMVLSAILVIIILLAVYMYMYKRDYIDKVRN